MHMVGIRRQKNLEVWGTQRKSGILSLKFTQNRYVWKCLLKRNSKMQRLLYPIEFDSKIDFEFASAESNLSRRTYLGGDMIQKDSWIHSWNAACTLLQRDETHKVWFCIWAKLNFSLVKEFLNKSTFLELHLPSRRRDMFFAKGYFMQIQPQNQVSSRIR